MRKFRRASLMLVLALALVFGTSVPGLSAATTDTQSISVPIFQLVFVPCVPDILVLDGPLHILTHVTVDNNGGFHVQMHFNPQGVTGEGLWTGDTYRAVGLTRWGFNVAAGVEYTLVNNFRMIGPGPGNNLSIHENFHFTVNANGELTAWVDNFSATCG